jgi:hypothetical protein
MGMMTLRLVHRMGRDERRAGKAARKLDGAARLRAATAPPEDFAPMLRKRQADDARHSPGLRKLTVPSEGDN